MTRLALLATLTLPLSAATITLTQSAAYQFTTPPWATDPPNAYRQWNSYEAELGTVPLADTSWLSFTVTGTGLNASVTPTLCCGPGIGKISTALPMVASASFVLTIQDLNPGVPVVLDFNDAYFGAVPVDPPIGGTAGTTAVPEPGSGWLVGLVSCVACLRSRMIGYGLAKK